MAEVTAKMRDLRPMVPMIMLIEITDEEGKPEMREQFVFIDQVGGGVYDLEGPVEDSIREGVFKFIEMKHAEAKRRAMSEMIHATPEQLAQAGIDLKQGPPQGGKIIVSGR